MKLTVIMFTLMLFNLTAVANSNNLYEQFSLIKYPTSHTYSSFKLHRKQVSITGVRQSPDSIEIDIKYKNIEQGRVYTTESSCRRKKFSKTSGCYYWDKALYQIDIAGTNVKLTKIINFHVNQSSLAELRKDISSESNLTFGVADEDRAKIRNLYLSSYLNAYRDGVIMVNNDRPGVSRLELEYLSSPKFTLYFSYTGKKLEKFNLIEGKHGAWHFKNIRLPLSDEEIAYQSNLIGVLKKNKKNLQVVSDKEIKNLIKQFQKHEKIYEHIVLTRNNIQLYVGFLNKFPNSKNRDIITGNIYKHVQSQDNIAGYSWFLNNYSDDKNAKKALLRMHELAFEMAKDIDTVAAYNDFIMAYPTAMQVEKATESAYKMEKSIYTGFFSKEEKEARRLLIKSKIIEQSGKTTDRNWRIGYMLVVNRMNDLLKKEFDSTDAVLRHLESNEFKHFVNSFEKSMSKLSRQLSSISKSSSDLANILKNQSSMMNNHFKNAAHDREMAAKITKQHRFWERHIGKVGQ